MGERGVTGDEAGAAAGVLQAYALMDEEGVDGGDDGGELFGLVEVLARVGEPVQDLLQLGGVLAALGEPGEGPLPAVGLCAACRGTFTCLPSAGDERSRIGWPRRHDNAVRENGAIHTLYRLD
ncbi:hypothetical protein [Streptomyces sp. RM99]|uniref:hypothetical protein n=1 Tax=Streptomyces sp. RM99 TaxID=2824897 RepID=UPI001B388BB6|nr:hypothetical protein [Streptomyces sp. RM99]MBQ0911016.1 hypothetical protein [Streptomyces sp. RM99]